MIRKTDFFALEDLCTTHFPNVKNIAHWLNPTLIIHTTKMKAAVDEYYIIHPCASESKNARFLHFQSFEIMSVTTLTFVRYIEDATLLPGNGKGSCFLECLL